MNILALLGLGFLIMGTKKIYDIRQAKDQKEKFFFYDELFKKYGDLENFPWKWLKAIAKQESDLGLDKRVIGGQVSGDGLSYGLMQIAEGVGSSQEIAIKGYGGREKLNDAEYSVKIAAKLISYLNRKYAGNPDKVFLAYNQGEKNTDAGKDFTTNYSPDKVSYKEKIKKWLTWIDQKEREYLS